MDRIRYSRAAKTSSHSLAFIRSFSIYIFAEQAKQLERLHSIFKDLNTEINFTPVATSIHEGFIDADLKIVCYTDHQIFQRYHKYRVKQAFNKRYSISGMTKWLDVHAFCYKKSHAVPAKADTVQQKKFVAFYNTLKAKAGKKEPIYFADSVHPQHQTHLAYGWILKGERKEMPTTGRQKRLNFMGGICLKGHQFFYQPADKIDADSIALFLRELRKRHSEKCIIHLIWDNAGYHKNGDVQAFAKDLGIKLHYLPPYSPNLNPIERLWKMMHEKVTYNKYYASFAEFTDATMRFLNSIGRKISILPSRITDNFQILHSPILAS